MIFSWSNHQTFEYYRFVQTTAIYFFRKEILYKVFVIEDFQKFCLLSCLFLLPRLEVVWKPRIPISLDSSFLLEKEGEEGWRERDAAMTEIMQIGLETLQRRVFDAASRITHPSSSPLMRGSIIGFPWRILGSL